MVLGVLRFRKNGIEFRFRKEATGIDASVIYSDLFLEVEEIIERRGQTVCAASYRANS